MATSTKRKLTNAELLQRINSGLSLTNAERKKALALARPIWRKEREAVEAAA